MASLNGTSLVISTTTADIVTVTNTSTNANAGQYPAMVFKRSVTPSGTSTNTYTAGRKFYGKTQTGVENLAFSDYVICTTSNFATDTMSVTIQQDGYSVASGGTNYVSSYIKQYGINITLGLSSGAPTAATDRIVADYSTLKPYSDGTINLGTSFQRFGTVYAVTGTINTSDINEKEQIENLDEAEHNVALAIKGLIKKFKWKSSVAEKGDNARIHIGVMAQEVRDAFISQGLDPDRYALFCKDVWWEREEPNVRKDPNNPNDEHLPDTEIKYYTEEVEDGVRKERYGVRYDQLLAFVIAAI